MRHRPRPALFERQPRLRPIQGLNLALLIHTPHPSFRGRIELESGRVGEPLQKLGITGEFILVRFQVEINDPGPGADAPHPVWI
jgi:hypothetical protein